MRLVESGRNSFISVYFLYLVRLSQLKMLPLSIVLVFVTVSSSFGDDPEPILIEGLPPGFESMDPAEVLNFIPDTQLPLLPVACLTWYFSK